MTSPFSTTTCEAMFLRAFLPVKPPAFFVLKKIIRFGFSIFYLKLPHSSKCPIIFLEQKPKFRKVYFYPRNCNCRGQCYNILNISARLWAYDSTRDMMRLQPNKFRRGDLSLVLRTSVTRLGDLLDFGQPFKDSGINYFTQIAYIVSQFL